MYNSRIKSIVLCGLCIALIAVGAAIQLPLGPIPFTLQTFMLTFVLLILTPAEALACVGGYLVLGAVGLPVFAGFKGGIGALLGPTGGFLLGFFLAAGVVSLIRILIERRLTGMKAFVALDLLLVVVINLVTYAMGTWWFTVATGTTVIAALVACVIPFLLPDIVKAVAALVCAQPVRVALGRAKWTRPATEPDAESTF